MDDDADAAEDDDEQEEQAKRVLLIATRKGHLICFRLQPSHMTCISH